MKRQLVLAIVGVTMIGFPAVTFGQVRVITDIDYVAAADYPNKKDRLDLYITEGAKPAPVILSIHGGGLRQGDKAQQAFVGQRFASAGYVTVVVN